MEIIVTSKPELARLIEESVARGVAESIPEEDTTKEWLTNPEALEFLQVSRPTLQRLRSSGKLPFSKVGSKLYYRRTDLERLLEEHIQS